MDDISPSFVQCKHFGFRPSNQVKVKLFNKTRKTSLNLSNIEISYFVQENPQKQPPGGKSTNSPFSIFPFVMMLKLLTKYQSFLLILFWSDFVVYVATNSQRDYSQHTTCKVRFQCNTVQNLRTLSTRFWDNANKISKDGVRL